MTALKLHVDKNCTTYILNFGNVRQNGNVIKITYDCVSLGKVVLLTFVFNHCRYVPVIQYWILVSLSRFTIHW